MKTLFKVVSQSEPVSINTQNDYNGSVYQDCTIQEIVQLPKPSHSGLEPEPQPF